MNQACCTLAAAALWLLAAVRATAGPPQAASAAVELQPGTVVRFASREQGREVLRRIDAYVEAMSPFDRAARLKTDRAVAAEELVQFAADQVLEWNDEDRRRVTKVLQSLAEKLARPKFRLPLPENILLIQTTGREEGRAAYCRDGAVILPRHMAAWEADRLEKLLAHELFHILSRSNPALRPQLYGVLGFEPCRPVTLPPELARRKITNPDAFALDTCIRLKTDDAEVLAMPVLLASSDTYDVQKGGEFFSYLMFRLLVLEPGEDSPRPATDHDGKAILLEPAKVPDYVEHVGRDTRYIIHPEEVLADYFSLWLTGTTHFRTPRIVEGMLHVLAEAAEKPPAGQPRAESDDNSASD